MLASGSNDGTICLWAAPDGSHKSTLEHGGVTSVIFSPDGKMLASGSNDGTICLWESEIRFGQNRCITKFDLTTDETPVIFTDNKSETAVTSVVFSPNGSMLASGHNNGTIHLWDIGTLQNKSSGIPKKHTDSIRSLDFSSDGRTLASGSKDKTICVWDTKAGEHLVTLQKHTDTVFSVVFQGDQLVSESSDSSIRFWNTETGKNEKTLVGGYIGNITSVVFSPNGQVLASIDNRGWNNTIIHFWDVNTGEIKTSITEKMKNLEHIHFSPDSRTFISQSDANQGYRSSEDKETIHFWDVNTGKIKTSITEKMKNLEHIHFSPDSRILVDHSGKFWDVNTGEIKTSIAEKINSFESIHFSPDGKTLLTIQKESRPYGYSNRDSDVNIHLWDIDTGEQKAFITEKIVNLKSVHFSPDSKTLVTIGTEKKDGPDGYSRSRKSSSEIIGFWDVATGKQKTSITTEVETFTFVRCSPDNKILAGVTASKIYFWDIETGKPKKAPLAKSTSNVESIAFSRDSRLLLSVNTNEVNDTAHSDTQKNKTSMFCFWDVETGEPIPTTLEEMTNNIESVIFSSDKTKFASVHSDNLIRLWDVDTGKHESTLEGVQEDIASVAFSLDNRTLACGSRNGMILLWDISK